MARSDQQTIPGTDPKIPPGILRQANRVLDLRDELELTKQRLEAATEYLQAAMARADLQSFRVPASGTRNSITFRLDQKDPVVKIEDYKKPTLDGSKEQAA